MAEGNLLLSYHDTVVYIENLMLRLHDDYTSDNNVRYLIIGEKVLLFILSEGEAKYIQSINDDGFITLGQNKKFWSIVRTGSLMFSIRVNDLFMSNRRESGSVCLVPQNYAWELYYDVDENPRLYNKIITRRNVEVYDCFPFFNEYELLELRLDTLYSYVDYFVIVEMNRTQNNEPKDWNFLKERKRYSRFLDKIRYIQVADEVPFTGQGDWSIENFQRNAIMRGIVDAKANDVIFISDCDEIWNPKTFEDIVANKADFIINLTSSSNSHSYEFSLPPGDVSILECLPVAMRQKMYMYRMNWRVDSPPWNGTVLVRRMNLSMPQDLRNARYLHITARNGGWHFTWQGGSEKIKKKLRSLVEGNFSLAADDTYSKRIYSGEEITFQHVEVDLSEIGLDKVAEFCRKYPKFYGSEDNGSSQIDEMKNKTDFENRISKFLKEGNLVINKDDMSDWKNFLTLLKTLYRKGWIRQNFQSVAKMSFGEEIRLMLLFTFLRLEQDNRLDLFFVKSENEMWLNFVPYREYEANKKIVVPKWGKWPDADKENTSSLLACIKIEASSIRISIEFAAVDIATVKDMMTEIGYERCEEKHDVSLFCIKSKTYHYKNASDMSQAVNEAMNEFCYVGEKLVTVFTTADIVC